ncbi:MAG: YceI family protein [Fimbriimonas sp.]|nr:YceI family protein [Fimbriimonas sp.]
MSTISPDSGPQKWTIDSSHSSIDFSVKHMGVFTVRGSLGAVTGAAETDGSTITSASLSIDIAGITTGNEQRDAHLKSADFLDVEKFPAMEFKSNSVEKISDAEYSLTGDLTIVGKTAPITIKVEIVPPVKDPWGNTRSGVTGAGKLLRSTYGITYNATLETGHFLIGDEISFTFDIQATAG